METHCHLGKVIRYDTVTHLGWSVDVRTHSIVQIIDRLLSEDWTQEGQEGRTVPEAKADDEDCVVSLFNFCFTANVNCGARIALTGSLAALRA